MGADGQPFMYDPVPKDTSRHPYNSFDPKAVTRTSLTPKPPKPKPDGPLVSFNRHPDSYLVLPYGNTNAKPMNPSIKKRVAIIRWIQWVLRCLELMGAIALLVVVILFTNIDQLTGWFMRIPPGFAILHTLYAVYHLSRRASGRTPASSASYMLFASVCDVSLLPFYAFAALMAVAQIKLTRMDKQPQAGEWKTLLPAGDAMMPTLDGMTFIISVTTGGLHLLSLVFSLWLAVIFRKITKLPPDMNPLEDNLTSRHKRNKSSISASTVSEKRTSMPLESKRNSGAPYEDLSRPPAVPFVHTRIGSTDSFSTYRTTPPGSRDSRLDLPSRQYQIESHSASARSSIVDLKRASLNSAGPPTPPKRSSYTEIPFSTNSTPKRSSRQAVSIPEVWQAADPLPTSQRNKSRSPKKGNYQPLEQSHDFDDHPNPLEANPPTPTVPNHRSTRSSALSEISYNQSQGSGDLADMSRDWDRGRDGRVELKEKQRQPRSHQDNFKAKYYGDLRAATPPVLIATGNGRQVSSGNDFGSKGAMKMYDRRDVSGKIAEEGRSTGAWRTRFRKISGLGA